MNMEKLEICLMIFFFLQKLQHTQVRLMVLAVMNRNRRQEVDLSIFALFNLINILFI